MANAGEQHGKSWIKQLFQIHKRSDDASNSTALGVPIVVVRKDTGASLVGTDSDWSLLQVDAFGNLRTTAKASGGDDSFTGRLESTDTSTQLQAAPGAGSRIEVSHFTVQNSTAAPVATSIQLLSSATVIWEIELSAVVAFGDSELFVPTLKLAENEALNIKTVSAATGVRYNVQSDVYQV